MSKKVFLDCGGNVGQSIERFKSSTLYNNDFTIYSFEPLKGNSKKYKKHDDVILYNEAVWVYDGEIQFFLSETERSCGNTLFKDKITGNIDKEHPISIPCIDFSKWVINTFSKDDYIILKMDIEGAEYEVLEKMLEDSSIEYINRIYIEWHYMKVGIHRKRHLRLIKKLKAVKGLGLMPEMARALRRNNCIMK